MHDAHTHIQMANRTGRKRLLRHLAILKRLRSMRNPQQIGAAVKNASPNLIKCLVDCCHNVSCGNIPVGKKTIKQLRRHKKTIRQILNRKAKAKRKRQLLSQSGGFLPLLLAPIIGLAGSLAGEAISSAISRR